MSEADNKNKDEDDNPRSAEQPQNSNGSASEQPPQRKPIPVTLSDIELEQLKRESYDYKDKYQRSLAEAENARKRLQKEKHELIQYSLKNVFLEFLNPIDHLENALKFADQASDEVKHWALGFQMILNQFKDVLSNNGVVTFTSVGTHFDPRYQHAVEMITTDEVPPGTVVSEILRGYKMGDNIIRPANVTVAQASSSIDEEQNDANEITQDESENNDTKEEQKSNS